MTAESSRRMLTAEEAAELSAGFQKLSGHWRWWLAVGLALVLIGFAVLVTYLDERRRIAEAVARYQKDHASDLDATLQSARVVVASGLREHPDDPRWQSLNRLISAADVQVTSIDRAAGELVANQPGVAVPAPGANPASTASAPAPAPPVSAANVQPPITVVRIFLHINDPAQRPAAQAVAAAWAGRRIGEASVVVPGIELVPQKADNTLRCTRTDSCAMADTVLQWINARLASPPLTKRDLSGKFAGATNIRPGTFEVWFAPGPISLRAGEAN